MASISTTPSADARPSDGIGSALWAVVATCGAYFCMYMFRKPFTAAKFEGVTLYGFGMKAVIVATQVLGYTISKFIGVKVVSEMDASRRIASLLALITIAEIALVGFGLTPAPWNIVWMFVNGLPLGMVFGLVLAFLEGRRRTEALAAGLCASFVFADGIAKSIGTWMIDAGVSESWMPAAVGALFIPAFGAFAWMLSKIPTPTREDVDARSARSTMSGVERRTFFRRFAFGLVMLLFTYGLIGVLRGLRGDFAPEIWSAMHVKVDPSVFAKSEMLAGAGTLIVFLALPLFKDNRRAFFAGIGLAIVGCVVSIAALALRDVELLSPFAFMACQGFGLYLPYFAVHTTIFERLIATTRSHANIGYLMYVADSLSYAAYVVILLARNLTKPGPDTFLRFYTGVSWAIAVACIAALIPAGLYFTRLRRSS